MTVKAMAAKEVARKVIDNEPLFILDVRNGDAFADWKIEGGNIQYLNTPYFDLLEGSKKWFQNFRKTETSLWFVRKRDLLLWWQICSAEEGVDVAYLEGGMKAWSEHLEPVKVGDLKNGGELYQFVRIGKGCLSYMVISGGEAAIIDATRMADIFLDFAQEKGTVIKHVFDTHLHADHISGGRTIAEAIWRSLLLAACRCRRSGV